jgi:hypothetical protein
MEDQETPYRQIALKFSTALLKGEFEEAYSFLGSTLREIWTPTLLQETYEGMIEYFEMPPDEIEVILIDTEVTDNQAGKASFYVSIHGESGAEAVIPMVVNENGKYSIQELEWGRP